MDGGFFVVYTRQGENTPAGYAGARDAALVRIAAIRRVIGENRERIGLALTAADAERLAREGKRIAFISMENSWPLGEDLSLLTTFHRLGPAHGRAGAQPHQPARRFDDRRGALERPFAARPAMGGGDEPARHRHRRQPQLGRGLRSDARAKPGSDRPLPFRAQGDLRPSAQSRRRSHAPPRPRRRRHVHEFDLPRPARQCARARRARRRGASAGRAERGRAPAIARRHRRAATASGPIRPPISTCSCARCCTPSP